MFQEFFCAHGIHQFFQRSDVQQEFDVSINQNQQLIDKAKDIHSRLTASRDHVLADHITLIFDCLPEQLKTDIESLMNRSVREIAIELAQDRKDEQIWRPFDSNQRRFYAPRRTQLQTMTFNRSPLIRSIWESRRE